MTGHHGIPDASEVFVLLLLLFIAPSELGTNCSWKYTFFLTADHTDKIEILKRWMLLDYQVFMPTNLKPDEFCRKIWDTYFIHKELVRMSKVSGENLTKEIENLISIIKFVEECNIKENDCIHFAPRNVSQFLGSIPSLFEALQNMESVNDTYDFSNCTIVWCQLDFTTPVIKLAEQSSAENQVFPTLDPKEDRRKTDELQSSQAATSRKHYWWLILLPTALLLIAYVVERRFPCRRPSQNQPIEPPEQL